MDRILNKYLVTKAKVSANNIVMTDKCEILDGISIVKRGSHKWLIYFKLDMLSGPNEIYSRLLKEGS